MASSHHTHMENSKFPEALNSIHFEMKNRGVNLNLIKAKIICLINMNKFTLALSTIKMSKSDSFTFEKAYCYYRLGKFSSALAVVEAVGTLKPNYLLLKGQILYRLERFSDAAVCFEDLISSKEFPVEDLAVNLVAARSQIKEDYSINFDLIESFEFYHNWALLKLASSSFSEALSTANAANTNFNMEVSESDALSAKIISLCASLNDTDSWPEAEFEFRKLKTSIRLTPIQNAIIDANLMAISTSKRDLLNEFHVENIKKLNLFKSQELQILANAHHFGLKLDKAQLKSISIKSNQINQNVDPSHSSVNIYDFKALKNDFQLNVQKIKKSSPSIEKEKWISLRDRSSYLPKAQYLKSLKKKVTKK